MSGTTTFSPDSVVVGQSPRMRAIFEFIRVIADGDATVLITGETGSGKEVVANMIHHESRRRGRPFAAVSCATFTETLIESELFGHERGAFTGAIKDRAGRFELAQGGTVFLDDIDDVPLSVQVKLLRVLQTHTVERVGGARAIPVDVRIVAGAKRDLRQLVADGKFRDDLYYRLNVLPIVLPPLRERREDIPALMQHFLARFFRRRGEAVPPISPAIRRAMTQYSWPGNVRELENACERIAQTCVCGRIQSGCMAASVLLQANQTATTEPVQEVLPAPPAASLNETILSISLDDRLREVEQNLIGWALRVTRGNKSKAADLLKIKRSTLGDRINRCGLNQAEESETPVPVGALAS